MWWVTFRGGVSARVGVCSLADAIQALEWARKLGLGYRLARVPDGAGMLNLLTGKPR